MSQELYLLIAIITLVVLLIVFIVSFVLYRRTPVPKGCENMIMNEEKCGSCSNEQCMFNKSRSNN